MKALSRILIVVGWLVLAYAVFSFLYAAFSDDGLDRPRQAVSVLVLLVAVAVGLILVGRRARRDRDMPSPPS
jgi:hypothetical protein